MSAGLGASLLNFIGGQFQNQQAFQQNMQLANFQNGLNIAQWKRENAYNSPANQMLRYKEAGLNPNLIYGQQNLSAQSPQLVGGTPMQSQNNPIIDANAVAQLDLLEAQKNNINADTKNKEANTEKTLSDIPVNEWTVENLKSQIGLNEEQAKTLVQQRNVMVAEIDKLIADTDYQKKVTSRYDEMMDAQINELVAKTGLEYAQINEIVKLLPYKVNLMISEAGLNNANAKQINEYVKSIMPKLATQLLNDISIQADTKRSAHSQAEIDEARESVQGTKGFQWFNGIMESIGGVLGIAIAAAVGGKSAGKSAGKSFNQSQKPITLYNTGTTSTR